MNSRQISIITVLFGVMAPLFAGVSDHRLRLKLPDNHTVGSEVSIRVSNPAYKSFTISGTIIDTKNNAVGIADTDVAVIVRTNRYFWQSTKGCALITMLDEHPGYWWVLTQSGRIIPNVQKAESALTGTPGYLMHKGFIGTRPTEEAISGLMGSGKRLDYFVAAATDESDQ